MDRLRQIIAYVNAQLTGLNVSQRLAIALCAALIGGSLLWLLQWSTTPELVPLVTRNFSFAELDAAEEALRSNRISFEIQGATILVRERDRHNALRVVHGAGALPEGSLFDMEAVVTNSNPFQSPEAREYAQNYAKGNELAKIIATSPAVSQASVIVNPRTRRRLGGQSDIPTASVTVTLAPTMEMTSDMVESFAKLVSGAVAGLKPHNVYVTDARTLRSYNVPGPDEAISFDHLRIVKDHEAHLTKKILNKLSDIPGVQVAVTVEVDTSKRVTQNVKHDPVEPRMETTQTTESNSGSKAAEPGVQANLGQAIVADGGAQTNTTEESTVENFEPKLAQTETIEQMPFATKGVTAAIGIPRSFVAGIYMSRFPDKEHPDEVDPEFTAIRDEQVARVRRSVERIVMAKKADDVVVDVYPDMDWSVEGGAWSRAPGAARVAVTGTEALDTVGLLQTYGPQAALLALALTSVFMMVRIARKAAPPSMPGWADHLESTMPPEEEPILESDRHPVGQAGVSESLLTGRELDEGTLRYQELGKEVTKMVEKDPEGAAELIKRWVNDA